MHRLKKERSKSQSSKLLPWETRKRRARRAKHVEAKMTKNRTETSKIKNRKTIDKQKKKTLKPKTLFFEKKISKINKLG